MSDSENICLACTPDKTLFFYLSLLLFACASLYHFRKTLLFVASVLQVDWRENNKKRPYFSDFGGIILGGVPYPSHEQYIREKRITMVVSLLEPHEQRGDGLWMIWHQKPLQPAFYQKNNIEFRNFPIPDLSTDFNEQAAAELLIAMHDHIEKGGRVLLHCQAGEGRSFMFLMAYLGQYGSPDRNPQQFSNYEQALEYVKRKRPQVANSLKRRTTVLALYKEIGKEKLESAKRMMHHMGIS